MRRNEQYWGGRVPWETASLVPIPNDTARVAALLAGDVEFINNVPLQDTARIQGDRRVALFAGPSIYAVNIYPDVERDIAARRGCGRAATRCGTSGSAARCRWR